VLLDRDGTLVVDVPYNGDPAHVRPMPGARAAIDRLRREGIRTAVVPGAAHWCHLEAPERVNEILLGFADELAT